MKNLNRIVVIVGLAIAMVSCKNSDREQAQTTVDDYTTYIDSVSQVAAADAEQRWDEIERYATEKREDAQREIKDLEDRVALEERMNESSRKYEEFKQNVVHYKTEIQAENARKEVRSKLFKGQLVENDMSFGWVNKDNILDVYDNFVNTVSEHKDEYTREQWDDIKQLYEALDTRKNTVENEGLTSADNLKIAGLKVRFATMYKINRIGAKAEENEEAKK